MPVSNFSLRAGDFAGDADTPLSITAFDAANNIIGTGTASWAAGQNPPFALLTTAATDIRKVVYSSGGTFAGSTFIDDITFTPTVPEPGSAALLVSGTLIFLRRRSVRK